MSGMTFKLRAPIEAHDGQLAALELARPTPEQVGRLGLPYKIDMTDGAMDFKMSTVMKYVSALAGIPASSVNQLHPADLNDLAVAITGFFQ